MNPRNEVACVVQRHDDDDEPSERIQPDEPLRALINAQRSPARRWLNRRIHAFVPRGIFSIVPPLASSSRYLIRRVYGSSISSTRYPQMTSALWGALGFSDAWLCLRRQALSCGLLAAEQPH